MKSFINRTTLFSMALIILISVMYFLKGIPHDQLSQNTSDRPQPYTNATVLRVVDGDTVIVLINGFKKRVRLLGINSPESVDPDRKVECFGNEASEHLKSLLDSKKILLETDPKKPDQDEYGRLLRYSYLENGTPINESMLKDGYAYEYTYHKEPYLYQQKYKSLEEYARSNALGLWSPATCNGKK